VGNFEKAILVIAGIAIGAVVTFFLTRPAPTPTASYAVRTYSNVEEWEIAKDSDGRVRGVKVHRKAEEG
jgi:hypothetical protein